MKKLILLFAAALLFAAQTNGQQRAMLVGSAYCWGNAASAADFSPHIKYENVPNPIPVWACSAWYYGMTLGQTDTVAAVSNVIVCVDSVNECTINLNAVPFDSCIYEYQFEIIDYALLDSNNDTVSTGKKLHYGEWRSESGRLQQASDTNVAKEFAWYTNPMVPDWGIAGTINRGWTSAYGETNSVPPDRDLDGVTNYLVINGVPTGNYTFVAVGQFNKWGLGDNDTIHCDWFIDRSIDAITCLGMYRPAPTPAPPAAPQGADVNTSGGMPTVSWDPVPGATSYELKSYIHPGKKTSAGMNVKTYDLESNTFTDPHIQDAAKTMLNKGQSWGHYIIKAKNAGGVSPTAKTDAFKL